MSYDMELWMKRLIKNEGMSLMPYVCPRGKLTIGVGRNLEDNPLNFEEKIALGDYMHGITENGAKMLLRNDVVRCYNSVKQLFKDYENLSEGRQYALFDMCFQLGVDGVKKFRIMRKAINDKDFGLASEACLKSLYAKQTPLRAKKVAMAIKSGVWK